MRGFVAVVSGRPVDRGMRDGWIHRRLDYAGLWQSAFVRVSVRHQRVDAAHRMEVTTTRDNAISLDRRLERGTGG